MSKPVQTAHLDADAIMERLIASAVADSQYLPQQAPTKPAREYRPIAFPLDFEIPAGMPVLKEAHRAVQWWLNDLLHNCNHKARWIILSGAPGCGKTHLLNNAHRTLREFRMKHVFKARAVSMADDLRNGKYEKIPLMWAPAHALFIDDFGAEQKSDYLTAKWYDLLDSRLGKWTFISTNLTPEQIADRMDVRISSRLYHGQNVIVDMSKALDWRKLHNQSA